ncbi:uncharacterized protein [Malus domestica]|uniref:uncharacterized protein n=1 Tax=Malus domestica TaxID=3750 RepID=UPI0039759CE6
MINAEAELANSLMQYEHHAESSYRGSVMGRSFVQRDREECHDRMMKDYFIEHPRFRAHDFRRRFRMRKELFESILNTIVNYDHYFARKIDVHAFFGAPVSNNDINVLWSSHLFDDVVNGWAPEFRYKRQESYTKDVERAFEILQARWAIVRGPARLWHTEDLHSIMMTCIILHNMIVEDEYIEIEEDSDKDVDDDQPTHARAMARDVEYLAATAYET